MSYGGVIPFYFSSSTTFLYRDVFSLSLYLDSPLQWPSIGQKISSHLSAHYQKENEVNEVCRIFWVTAQAESDIDVKNMSSSSAQKSLDSLRSRFFFARGSWFSVLRGAGKKRLNKLNPSPAWWDPMLCLPLWWNAISSSPDLSIVPGYSRVIPILKHCPVGYEITNCWLSHEPSELLYTLVSAKDHSSAIMDNLPCSHTFPQRDTRPGEVHNIFFTKLRCQGKGYD